MSEPGWERFAATLGNITAVAVVKAGNASQSNATSVSFKALGRKQELALRARGAGRVTWYFRWTSKAEAGAQWG